MNLHGKIAFITGSSSGIGAACALRFVEAGAIVAGFDLNRCDSGEGLEAQEFTAPYNASKGAVVLLSKNMAIDYGRWGIRVNALCPGYIDTPLLAAMNEPTLVARISEAHQAGRMGTPREVANVAAFLASDEASFVSGSALTVDGGYTAGKRFGIADLFGLAPPAQ